MKIIYLCKGSIDAAGMRHLGYDWRFFNGLVRGNHAVHFFAVDEYIRQKRRLGMKRIGIKHANAHLLHLIDVIRPDALIFSRTVMPMVDALAEIRIKHPHVRTAQINVDALFAEGDQQGMVFAQPHVDASFVTTGGAILAELSKPGMPVYFIPNVSDSSIDTGRAFAQEHPPIDVSCMMHGHHDARSDHDARIQFARSVKAALPEASFDYRGFDGAPSAYGAEYHAVYANSAMALNVSRDSFGGNPSTPAQRHMYSSDRVAHIMGNGALAISQHGFALDTLYTSDEMVFFSSAEELIEHVRYLLKNPAERQRIAHNGWKKAHDCFNSTIIMQYVLDRLFERASALPCPWQGC